MAFTPTRRNFLMSSVGLAAAGYYGFSAFPALPYRGNATAQEAKSWLTLTEGKLNFKMPRAEMGQGLEDTFKQIISKHTGFPLAHISIDKQETHALLSHKATVGSDTMKDIAPLLIKASQDFAAKNASPILQNEEEKSATKSIIQGEKDVYVSDLAYDKMIYAALIKPPHKSMRLKAVDFKQGEEIKLIKLKNNRIALIAPSFYALQQARLNLKTTWEGVNTLNLKAIYNAIDIDKSQDFEHKVKSNKIDTTKPFDIDLRFDIPLAAHAPMEPRCSIARFNQGMLTIDTASQDATYVHRHCAKQLSLAKDKVFVTNYRMGGAFGGKTIVCPEIEAAEIAVHLNDGRPVKVQWTREDEFQHSFFRPPSSHRVKIRLGEQGEINDYSHTSRSGHILFTSAAMGAGLQFATSFIKDFGVFRGAIHSYAAKNQFIAFDDVRLPIDTGPWRGLGALPNGFVVETAMNEIARKIKQDPLDFRLRSIVDNPRLKAVLQDVATLADWKNRLSTPQKGYGIACGIYKDSSYVAVVAEVMMVSAVPKVIQLWCSHDCGEIYNASKVKAQIEGNLIWGLSSVFYESLGIDKGEISANFYSYPLARMVDCPTIHISLLKNSHTPSGAGETAIIATPAAITSAITAMTGQVITKLPLS